MTKQAKICYDKFRKENPKVVVLYTSGETKHKVTNRGLLSQARLCRQKDARGLS